MSQQVRIVYIEANNPSPQVMDSIQDFLHSLIDGNEHSGDEQPSINGAAVTLPAATPVNRANRIPAATSTVDSPQRAQPTAQAPTTPVPRGRPPRADSAPKPVAAPDSTRGQKVVVWVEESGKELTRIEAAQLAGVHATFLGQKLQEAKKTNQREFRVRDKIFRIVPGVSLGA